MLAFFMLNNKYKIKESVDIYTFSTDRVDCTRVQFYKINTREKLTIEIDSSFLDVFSSMDGSLSLKDILLENKILVDAKEIEHLVEYLLDKNVIKEVNSLTFISEEDKQRYSRQINYFDDLIPDQEGELSQYKLMKKNIVIIGCGSVGGMIASQLVRAGVINITLIDYKTIDRSSLVRHVYANEHNIGSDKIVALSEHLKKINSKANITEIKTKITPNINLEDIVPNSSDLVINTADEPYIGHISVKLGRYLWHKNIGLYIAGGFDAHLMSSGELIYKGRTPCIDCCSNTFRYALKDWKPKYNHKSGMKDTPSTIRSDILIGGSGGTFAQSLYSSSIACMNVIDFLLRNFDGNNKINKRGEFLIERCEQTWFEMKKQKGCSNCG
ncbi:ThiF family adenylyltransferase [Vibrio metschnikovii]|nr:ThiF family adenylyltransferase [Vibrio metschnikovii]